MAGGAGDIRRALARVDVGAVERNCRSLKERVGNGTELCAVVKADGYGHGAAACAAAAIRGEATEPAAPGGELAEDLLLTNEIGLHARPAAMLARTVSELDATVTVSFNDKQADARSVLAIMALGARGGDTVHISATGPQASEALHRIHDLAGRGFDE